MHKGTDQTPGYPPHNLPVPLTSFIGRERDVAAITGLLSGDDPSPRMPRAKQKARLLTLTGPGGTGKTRLALEAAATLLGSFPDGVYFVDLAPLRSATLVTFQIAKVLGVTEEKDHTLTDRLKEYLAERRTCLLLDNFEQVADAASLVSGLLSACPHLTVLITSRMPLRVSGEHEYAVLPLSLPPSLPDGDHLPSPAAIIQYESIQLFIDRAAGIRAGFELTNDNAPAVAEICRHLDGLPLAIELAAARAPLLTPQAMLARLQDEGRESRLKLPAGGAHDLPARGQTLRAAIEWSYDLLSTQEQKLFRRSTVFAGGCGPAGIEAVCDADGDLNIDILAGVESLIARSLLRQAEGAGGEPRFVMLATISEFAREKLAESGEAEALKREHALYFTRLAEEAEPHLKKTRQQEWLDRLDDEYDNLRAALGWSLERQSAEALDTGLRLAAILWRFWEARGQFSEGREWLSAFISAARSAPGEGGVAGRGSATELSFSRGLPGVLKAAGWLAARQGDYQAARPLLEQSLEMAGSVGDKATMAQAFNMLGRIAALQGDQASARALYEQGLALFTEVGDKWGVALSLNNLGQVASELGDYPRARLLHGQSLILRREVGDKVSLAQSVGSLAQVAFMEGDYRTAQTLYEQCVALKKDLGDRWGLAIALGNLASVLLMRRDYGAARSLYEQSISLAREVGDKVTAAAYLAGLGAVAVQSGPSKHAEKAARLLGASDALLEALGAVREADDRIPYDYAARIASAQLGAEAFERACQEGRSMSIQEALQYALHEGEGSYC